MSTAETARAIADPSDDLVARTLGVLDETERATLVRLLAGAA